MRIAPASGGAIVARPGMNLPRTRVIPPQRSKWFSVWRTHESGDSEMRQRVVMTRRPYCRPATYQAESPIMEAAKATPKTAGADSVPSTASAPATISVGIAGSGTPSCSSSTLAKINASPCRAIRSSIASFR